MTAASQAISPADILSAQPEPTGRAVVAKGSLLWTLAAFLTAPVALFGLLIAAQSVPDSAVLSGLQRYEHANDFLATSYPPDGVGGMHDGFTDCIELTYGLGATTSGERGLIRYVAHGTHLTDGCTNAFSDVNALANGKHVQGIDYFRYWHGYSVVTRPLIALVGVDGLRSVILLLLVLGVAFCCVSLGCRLGWRVTAALLLPVAVTTNVAATPFETFSQAISWAVILSGVGAVAAVSERWGARGGVLAAAASAVAFNYVDLLTTPAVPWAWASFVVGATVWRRSGSRRKALLAIAATGTAWPMAYAYTWASKWLITAALLGTSSLSSVTKQMRWRLSGAYAGMVDTGLGVSTAKNLAYWLHTFPVAPVLLLITLVVVTLRNVQALRRGGWRHVGAITVVSLPALIIPLWYEVLKNHSQIHCFFTYRSIPAAIGIVLAAAHLLTAGGVVRKEKP